MLRKDLQMLATACLVAALLMLAECENISKNIETQLAALRQSEKYQSYLAFKNAEASFWAKIKGNKPNKGEIADILKDANVVPPAGDANAPAPTQTPAEVAKIAPPVKFLLVGDSMMLVGFGPALENSLLKYPGVSVVREGVYSTGLNRVDYFDWYTKTDELCARQKPDILVVMVGANDGQGIIDQDGKAREFGSAGWAEVYRQRVAAYLARTSPQFKRIYWVGHPIPGNESFMSKFSAMNPIYQSEVAKFPKAVFVDTWERFAVNGAYRQSIPDDNGLWQIAKQSDGVHVTEFGGRIMAGLVLKEVLKDVDLKQ